MRTTYYNIYLYYIFLRSQKRDVNPHVLLFSAFAHVKLIPEEQMLVFLMDHGHLFFLIEFSSNLKYYCR